MAEDKAWKTAITGIIDNIPHVRGYNITEMIDKLNFTQAAFLVLKGELPKKAEEAMMNAILVAVVDHGVSPPSAFTARAVKSAGNPLNSAVAGGILAIGDSHGGAIEQAAKIFQEGVARSKKGKPAKEIVREIVEKARLDRERVPGFGHPIYVEDPRTQTILKVAKTQKFYGPHIEFALEIQKQLAVALGKPIALNVDGAIAAIISEMGFDWRLGKAFFILGRLPGIIAHAHEEAVREKPYRRIDEKDTAYDGPKPRKIK